MKNLITITLIASGMMLLAAMPAASQAPCAPIERMLAMLAEKYGEQVILHGRINGTVSMRFTASRSGSWSAIIVKNGVACLRMSGERLRPGPDPQEQGEPS